MSYCRFSEADVYIYDDVHYGIICCACWLMPGRDVETDLFGEFQRYFINENFVAGTDYDKVLSHIVEHRDAGHYVPDHVDRRLILERDCTHEFYEDSNYCKICWVGKYKQDFHDADD